MYFWDQHKTITSYYELLAGEVCDRYGLTQMEYDILMFLHNNPQHNTAAGSDNRFLSAGRFPGADSLHASKVILSLAGKNFGDGSSLPLHNHLVCIQQRPAQTPGQQCAYRAFSAAGHTC